MAEAQKSIAVQCESSLATDNTNHHHKTNTLASTKSCSSNTSYSSSGSSSSGVSSADSSASGRLHSDEDKDDEHIYDQTDDCFYSESEPLPVRSSSVPVAVVSPTTTTSLASSTSVKSSVSSIADIATSASQKCSSQQSAQNRLKRQPISAHDWQNIYEDLDMNNHSSTRSRSESMVTSNVKSIQQQQHLMQLHKMHLHQQTQQFVASQQRLLTSNASAQHPSKLVPVSGVLVSRSQDKSSLVRPIAFKPFQAPVLPPKPTRKSSTASSPFSSLDSDDQTSGSHSLLADLPPRLPPRVLLSSTPQPANLARSAVAASQSSGSTSSASSSSSSAMGFRDRRARASPLCSSSSPVDDDEIFCLRPNLRSTATTRAARQSNSEAEGSISEVEQLLREKDNEIAYLRETLEQNEQVIFKVYEEKENAWKRELNRLRNQLEASQSAAQRALQRQQQQITQQMQQLQSQQEQLSVMQQRLQESKTNQSELAAELKETQQKAEEQSQLIESVGVQLQKANEQMSKQSQEAQDARHLSEQLAVQLAAAAEQRVRLCNRFASEQQKWMVEKRDVIAYHKQMQAAHVRTQQRNKQMEMELKARVCARCMQNNHNEPETSESKPRQARPATPVNSTKQLKVDSTASEMQSALPVTCE